MADSRILDVNGLHVSLAQAPHTPLLNGVSFSLSAGSIYALVGESGSGKSLTALSILRLLPNALSITGGRVHFKGDDLFACSERHMQQVRGQKIAMIFQDPQSALNPVHTIGAQIGETLKIHTDVNRAAIKARVLELMHEVGLPEPETRYSWYPHQLSGGQQQRVMIAMALACEPEVLLADEPTTALDVTIERKILQLLQTLTQKRRLAVLLITHDITVVQQVADRVGVMQNGYIVEDRPTAELFARPQHPYTQQLLNSLPDKNRFRERSHGERLLQISDLAVHFPVRKGILQRVDHYIKAVDGVSFAIHRGETLALVGESGSGKSTTGRAILRLEHATNGEIHFDGINLRALSQQQLRPLRQKIQVIFQDPYGSMNPRMTVQQIIEEGMISVGKRQSRAERLSKISELLQQVKLNPEHQHRYPHEFSGGQRQRIAIARALAVEPELIICDEPTSALDMSIRVEVLDLLLELQAQYGLSYLFITHDLSIIPKMAHQIAVMKDGKIVEHGSAQQVLQQPQHPYTQTLLSPK